MDAQSFHDIGIKDTKLAEAASMVAHMVRAAQQIVAHTSLRSDEPAVLAPLTQAIASVYSSGFDKGTNIGRPQALV